MKKREAVPPDNDPDEDYAEEYEPRPRKGKKITKPKKTYGSANDQNKAYGDAWDS